MSPTILRVLSPERRFQLERGIAKQLLQLPGPIVSGIGWRRQKTIDGRTLDPQLAALIEIDQLRGALDITRYEPEKARRKFAASIALLAFDPEPSVSVRRLQVAGAERPLEARLYSPPQAPAHAPLIVYFHGGGMVIGDLDGYEVLCQRIALRTRCRVISVAYRLAPEHPFPAAPDDAMAAFRDIASRAAELGADPSRLAVMGDSAGGTLSAVVSQHLASESLRPALQVLVYPAVDLTRRWPSYGLFSEGYLLTRRMMDWFMNHYLPAGVDRHQLKASPLLREDLRGVAPALVYTAGFDPLRDEGNAYAEKLKAAGLLVRWEEFGSLAHGFATMGHALDAARGALDVITSDVSRALRS
jgi:acetyl esterase